MVIDDLAEEDFVHADLLGLSQPELDHSGRTEFYAVAVPFAGRIRFFARDHRAIGLGVIRTTRVS